VRVAIFSLTTCDRRVEVEGCAFRRGRAELAVLLQLQSAEQRIVPEIYGRRLFRVWKQKNRRFAVASLARVARQMETREEITALDPARLRDQDFPGNAKTPHASAARSPACSYYITAL